MVQSPPLHCGGSKWLVDSPRVSSSGDSLLDNSSHFLSLLSNARSHMDSILKPNLPPPISSTFFRTTLLSPSFHPKLLFITYPSPLILIFMLLLISGDIHSNPDPIDPCSVYSHRVTWGNRSIQCTNCSLWVHLSYSGLSPTDFCKISPGHSWTCPMCPSSSQSPSHTLILYLHPFTLQIPHPYSQTPTKPYLQK